MTARTALSNIAIGLTVAALLALLVIATTPDWRLW